MKKLIQIIIIFLGYVSFGQDSIPDWKSADKSLLLIDYIESEVYPYLNFDHKASDFNATEKITISHEGSDTEVIIRDTAKTISPFIIINDYPLENLKVLEIISLQDIEDMDIYKPTAKLSSDYGYRAKHGLIKILMNDRKWRKIKRKNGR